MLGDQLRKKDAGKPRYSLLPFRALEQVVRVLEFGLEKYKLKDSWQTVDNALERYHDAAMRHLAAAAEGEGTDSESGLSHYAHAAADCLFLIWFAQRGDLGLRGRIAEPADSRQSKS